MANAPKLMRVAAMESGGGRDYPTITQAEPWHRSFVGQLNCKTLDVCTLCEETMVVVTVCDTVTSGADTLIIDLLSPICFHLVPPDGSSGDAQKLTSRCQQPS